MESGIAAVPAADDSPWDGGGGSVEACVAGTAYSYFAASVGGFTPGRWVPMGIRRGDEDESSVAIFTGSAGSADEDSGVVLMDRFGNALWTGHEPENHECGKQDLNLHGITTTRPSTWRVCQFRHSRGVAKPVPSNDEGRIRGFDAFWTGLPVSQADAPKRPADGAPAGRRHRQRRVPPQASQTRRPSRRRRPLASSGRRAGPRESTRSVQPRFVDSRTSAANEPRSW